MKYLKQPVIAIILCLIICFASGVISTRVQVGSELNNCKDQTKYEQLISELKEDCSHFPGNVFISCSGLHLN